MDDLKVLYENAVKRINDGVSSASSSARSALSTAAGTYESARRAGEDVTTQVEDQLKHGKEIVQDVEHQALTYAKQGILFAVDNPVTSYSTLAVGTLLVVPGTRRLLYRLTLGRWRNEEAIAKAAEERLGGVTSTLDACSSSVEALESKMVLAEEELKRGKSSLREVRAEMLRLAGVVRKSERVASDLVENLRDVRAAPNALQLRAEAASKRAALKEQRAALEKYIYRISANDV